MEIDGLREHSDAKVSLNPPSAMNVIPRTQVVIPPLEPLGTLPDSVYSKHAFSIGSALRIRGTKFI
jgi:hypothetical protein